MKILILILLMSPFAASLERMNEECSNVELYFKKEKSLVLCEIEERNLNRSEYLFEKALSNNRSEQDFPHIYGKLGIEQISKTWKLERNAFQIPKEILLELE